MCCNYYNPHRASPELRGKKLFKCCLQTQHVCNLSLRRLCVRDGLVFFSLLRFLQRKSCVYTTSLALTNKLPVKATLWMNSSEWRKNSNCYVVALFCLLATLYFNVFFFSLPMFYKLLLCYTKVILRTTHKMCIEKKLYARLNVTFLW